MKKALLALLVAAGLSSCTLQTGSVGVNDPVYYVPTRAYYTPSRAYIYTDIRPDYIRYCDPWASRRRHHHHCR